ncbi:hypothetical protein B0I33_112156 [Prauserella shujinwangii]|uniref:Uncharacterized protein n=1 Tax=Prauserella shujinwangii TaxID=1453103 RepID=A0A2T0LMH1_9PSEU|nr:hypothetical protein [Prauserella shujinwangii]PRX44278.1 hypothetical protein B0I33_112156 [Prauserella shujinwangii]
MNVPVDDAGLRRARRWLVRHGAPGQEPDRLLAARMTVRERMRHQLILHALMLAFLVIGFAVLREFVRFSVAVDGVELMGPLLLAGAYLLAAASAWWLAHRKRRAEQRIAATLPRRTAHSAVRLPREVLGAPFLAAVAVTYAGGVALGAGMLLFGGHLVDRVLGLILTAGTLVFGVLTALVAGEEVRRPALADGDAALAVDDLLRTQDSHQGVPYSLPVALVMSMMTVSPVFTGLLLGYVAVALLLWGATYLTDHRRPLPRTAAEPTR